MFAAAIGSHGCSPTRALCYPDRSRVRLTGAGQPDNTFGSRTVSDNPPRHSGIGVRRDV
jgi:hypothetical protein